MRASSAGFTSVPSPNPLLPPLKLGEPALGPERQVGEIDQVVVVEIAPLAVLHDYDGVAAGGAVFVPVDGQSARQAVCRIGDSLSCICRAGAGA